MAGIHYFEIRIANTSGKEQDIVLFDPAQKPQDITGVEIKTKPGGLLYKDVVNMWGAGARVINFAAVISVQSPHRLFKIFQKCILRMPDVNNQMTNITLEIADSQYITHEWGCSKDASIFFNLPARKTVIINLTMKTCS